MVVLVEDCLPASPVQNLLHISNFIKEYQKAEKRQFKQRLHKLTMIQPKKGCPKLRGRAADIQSLHGALLELWTQKIDRENTQHRQIRLFLDLNHRLQNLLDEFSPTFGFVSVPEELAAKLVSTGQTMAQIHAILMDHYKAENRQLYNMTSKTHFSMHSLMLARYIHPSMVWCYRGETTMHRLQVLWKSCLPGCKHWQVGMKAAVKESFLLCLRASFEKPKAKSAYFWSLLSTFTFEVHVLACKASTEVCSLCTCKVCSMCSPGSANVKAFTLAFLHLK